MALLHIAEIFMEYIHILVDMLGRQLVSQSVFVKIATFFMSLLWHVCVFLQPDVTLKSIKTVFHALGSIHFVDDKLLKDILPTK